MIFDSLGLEFVQVVVAFGLHLWLVYNLNNSV